MSSSYPGKKYSESYGGGGKNVLEYKSIKLASDFPTNAEADAATNTIYVGGTDPTVTDNDPSKTNTGFILKIESEIFWDKTSQSYNELGPQAIWTTDSAGNRVYLVIPADIDLQNFGLKDAFVSSSIKLGDVSNTSFNTANKTIVGSLNEIHTKTLKTASPATYLATETIVGIERNLPVSGNGGVVTLTSNPQITPGFDGEEKTLIGTSNTNTLTVIEGNGLSLDSGQPFTLGLNDYIEFIFYDSLWLEKSRKDNQ